MATTLEVEYSVTFQQASVIIPAHNAAATLHRQLEALAAQLRPRPFEVIVVANRCTDGTVAEAESFDRRLNLRVVRADGQASAAYARNVGAAAAVGRYLLFCDADDRVGSKWVASMVEPLEAGRADIVGGLIQVNRDGLRNWMYRCRYAWLDQRYVMNQQLPFTPRGLPIVMSASLGVTAEAFSAVGGFDTTFVGAASEDSDLCRRLLRSGYRIGEATGATIVYEPRRTARSVLSQARAWQRGGIILAAKEGHLGRFPSVSFAAWNVAKTAAYQVLREKEFNPLAVYGTSRVAYFRFNEQRRWIREHGELPTLSPDHFDFCVQLDAPIVGGLAFASGPSEQAIEYAEQGIETNFLRIMEKLLPETGVFVDVGASIGIYTVAAARCVGQTGRVVAFERSATARSFLNLNIYRHRVNERVQVRSAHVGGVPVPRNSAGSRDLLTSGWDVEVSPASPSPIELVEEGPFAVVTLSEAVSEAADRPVDMVRVDVDGLEAQVVKEAVDLIKRNPRGVLLLEFNQTTCEAGQCAVQELLEPLLSGGWDLFLIDKASDELTDALTPLDRTRLAHIDGADPAVRHHVVATRKPCSTALLAAAHSLIL
jgi:FkbM family methyltransferase